MNRVSRIFILSSLFPTVLTLASFAQSRLQVTYIPYQEAVPILAALADVLPSELKTENVSGLEPIWPRWTERRDTEIRARLVRGEEDTLVNFLLFGTTFTRKPRVTTEGLKYLAEREKPSSVSGLTPQHGQDFAELLSARIEDLLMALSSSKMNDHLLFARHVLAQKGLDLSNASGRKEIEKYLIANLARVLGEQNGYARALEAARLLTDRSEEFAERSRLYRDRGLSLDTSLLPNFALEESLKAMQGRALLAKDSVRRVGIIGPGLDFTDKHSGYDFYPQQTIQPFAVIDTLLRLGLARADALELITFDIGPRVNDHLARARQRAQRGFGYTVQLPCDVERNWKPDAARYWERFGDQIGTSVQPVPVPAGLPKLKIRAVRICPSIVSRVRPLDLNIVLQRAAVSSATGFDLIVATNVFVYYDLFEQCLGLANVERMLRPGGFLLSNNALLELPKSKMRSVDYVTTVYSDRPDDGDHIVWYQRLQD